MPLRNIFSIISKINNVEFVFVKLFEINVTNVSETDVVNEFLSDILLIK